MGAKPSPAITQLTSIPETSRLPTDFLARTTYTEAMLVCPVDKTLTPLDACFAIFGHRPLWMKLIFQIRNAAASALGLESSSWRDLFAVTRSGQYHQNDKILGWHVYQTDPGELIVGRDNKHLDFRVSLLCQDDDNQRHLIVSTLVAPRNRFGQRYLAAILPFHRQGFAFLIRRAMRDGRL